MAMECHIAKVPGSTIRKDFVLFLLLVHGMINFGCGVHGVETVEFNKAYALANGSEKLTVKFMRDNRMDCSPVCEWPIYDVNVLKIKNTGVVKCIALVEIIRYVEDTGMKHIIVALHKNMAQLDDEKRGPAMRSLIGDNALILLHTGGPIEIAPDEETEFELSRNDLSFTKDERLHIKWE